MDPITAALLNIGMQVGTQYLMNELGGDDKSKSKGKPRSKALSPSSGSGQWSMRQSVPPPLQDRYSQILQSILSNKPNNNIGILRNQLGNRRY